MFVDANGVSCFFDANGVTSWFDANGVLLTCDDVVGRVFTIHLV